MDDVQAVKKVLAEGLFPDGFLEVLVGGGNDPKVAVQGHSPSYPAEFMGFQDSQEINLHF